MEIHKIRSLWGYGGSLCAAGAQNQQTGDDGCNANAMFSVLLHNGFIIRDCRAKRK
jgi:hypothetical protein